MVAVVDLLCAVVSSVCGCVFWDGSGWVRCGCVVFISGCVYFCAFCVIFDGVDVYGALLCCCEAGAVFGLLVCQCAGVAGSSSIHGCVAGSLSMQSCRSLPVAAICSVLS